MCNILARGSHDTMQHRNTHVVLASIVLGPCLRIEVLNGLAERVGVGDTKQDIS